MQIFVEVERARVTRILSNIKKSQGDIKGAADILCELQVETFGSMERREKTEFILDQVALCIENNDFSQAAILSRKISTKYFARKPKKTAQQLEAEKKEREEKAKKGEGVEEEKKKEDDVTDLKLRYYEQQIILAKHEDKYLDVCKHYRQVLDTEAIEENPTLLREVGAPFPPFAHTQSNFALQHRPSNKSSTTSSSPLTTTNNPISYTEFSATRATPNSCPWTRNS